MKTEVKKINWIRVEGHFGNDFISDFECALNYYIWIDRISGKTKCSDLHRQHKLFNSIDEAKEFCQKDWENFIQNQIKVI